MLPAPNACKDKHNGNDVFGGIGKGEICSDVREGITILAVDLCFDCAEQGGLETQHSAWCVPRSREMVSCYCYYYYYCCYHTVNQLFLLLSLVLAARQGFGRFR